MADRKLYFTIGADTGPGSKAFDKLARDAKKSMGDVDSALDDTESAGKRLAAALEGQFESIDAAITETKATADTLAAALGPELAGKIDTAAAVQEFQRLGLSLEEIEADADSLAAALKKADDVSLKHMTGESDRAKGSVDDLGKSAGTSKSVLANMVGNSVQDLGAVAGVAGSAGVAIGQMGEYMADARADGDNLGQILRGFGGVAVPIVAISTATQLLSSAFEKGRKAAEMQAEGVKRLTKAAEEGTGVLGALQDQIEDTGKLSFTLGGGFDFAGIQVGDLRKNLAELGLTLDDFADFTDAGTGSLEDFYETNKDVLGSNKDWVAAFAARDALNQQLAQSELDRALNTRIGADADEDAAKKAGFFGDAVKKLTGEIEDNADAAGDDEDAVDDLGDTHREAQAKTAALREEMARLRGEMQNAAGDAHNLERAQLALDDALAGLEAQQWENLAVQQDATASAADQAAAARSLREAELSAADAAWALAQRTAEQAGAADGSTQKMRIMISSLQEQANKYPHLRDEIQAYIDQLNRIPTSKTTNVNTIFRQSGQPNAGVGTNRALAKGGDVEAGEPVIVGDKFGVNSPSAELFVPDTAGTVYPNFSTTSGTPTGGSGGGTYNVAVYMPPGSSIQQVTRSLARKARVNGPAWARRRDAGRWVA